MFKHAFFKHNLLIVKLNKLKILGTCIFKLIQPTGLSRNPLLDYDRQATIQNFYRKERAFLH